MRPEANFYLFNELFLNLGAVNSAAELQGMLCGRLSGGAQLSAESWLEKVTDFMDIGHVQLSEEQRSQIRQLYHDTLRLLEDVNFAFVPMLPGDEASIDRRTAELAAWCQGFLHGIGLSGLDGDAQLSPEVADALRDLAQISQASVDGDDDLAENEVYWQELVEYVKVAVLTVYTEVPRKAKDNESAVH